MLRIQDIAKVEVLRGDAEAARAEAAPKPTSPNHRVTGRSQPEPRSRVLGVRISPRLQHRRKVKTFGRKTPWRR